MKGEREKRKRKRKRKRERERERERWTEKERERGRRRTLPDDPPRCSRAPNGSLVSRSDPLLQQTTDMSALRLLPRLWYHWQCFRNEHWQCFRSADYHARFWWRRYWLEILSPPHSLTSSPPPMSPLWIVAIIIVIFVLIGVSQSSLASPPTARVPGGTFCDCAQPSWQPWQIHSFAF